MLPLMLALVAMSAGRAERSAGDWWGEYYRGDRALGAAWVDPEDGRHYVGVCDGTTDKAGSHREFVGEPGAWHNVSWEAKFKTPGGKFYRNAAWFGYGRTWEEAFAAAARNGYPLTKLSRPADGPVVVVAK